MAVAAPGSVSNAEWGFTPDDSSVWTIGGTNVGYIEGDLELSVPREYNFLQLDQARVELAAVCIRKEMILSGGFGEALQANLQDAWDNADADPVVVDSDMQGVVAVVVNTNPPNNAGSDTRVISMPTALATGDGALTIGQSAKQVVGGVTFKAIADANQLLGTITDTYA